MTVLPEVSHDAQITTVCVSTKSDERYIVCGSADATLSVFDRQLNHRQALLVGHDDQVLAPALLSFQYSVSVSTNTIHDEVVAATDRQDDRCNRCVDHLQP